MVSFEGCLLLTIVLSSITLCYGHTGYQCKHGEIKQNPGFLDIEEEGFIPGQGRVLQSNSTNTSTNASTSYPNMRLYAYYEFVEETASSDFADYIQNDLIPPIISYFQAALQVKYPVSGNLTLSKSVTTICERNTPSILYSGVPADYFIYFDTELEGDTQIANTAFCYLASGSNRPIISRTMINRNMLTASTADVVLHEQNMYVFMHEMMHTMAFSPSIYPYFLDANGKTLTGHIQSAMIAGLNRTIIDVAPLTANLQAFYGCSSLPGAIMENDGNSATSSCHFERKYFYYDIMTSGAINGYKLSNFTMNMLEGSGWYIPNYSYAEPFSFGQGQGCAFIDNVCNTTVSQFSEYCTGDQKACSPQGGGAGYCYADSLMDGCMVNHAEEDYYCEYSDGVDYASLPSLQVYGRSAGSQCFDGTLASKKPTSGSGTPNAFCFKYSCSGSGTNTTLTVQVGTQQLVCKEEGTLSVSGYYGVVNCPDPLTFCSTVGLRFCPRNCMGRGTCVNNQCQCNSGYTGIDCALGV